MEKVKLGLYGSDCGNLTANYCKAAGNATLVAVCDHNAQWLENFAKSENGAGVYCCTDLEDFLKQDIDAVLLSSEYATDQTRLTIACLEAGKHVLGGLMPIQTMAEAVALVEAVEKSGKLYAFGETHSYFPSTMEMKRLYDAGKLGEFEYGEGEYLHDCEPFWSMITEGDPMHWRNRGPSTFYCAHSVGPLIHATGLRPVKVTAFEPLPSAKSLRLGHAAAPFVLMVLELENGGLIRCNHGLCISKTSIWYSLYGTLGRAESARDTAQADDIFRVYTILDTVPGENIETVESYLPQTPQTPQAQTYHSHGGSHYYCVWNFVEKILGNPEADTVDIYQALDMSIPGILGYESIRKGNVAVDIPNFRDPAAREPYRGDNACTDPKKAGDQLLPTHSKGTPVIPQEVYDKYRLG